MAERVEILPAQGERDDAMVSAVGDEQPWLGTARVDDQPVGG